MKKTHLGSKVDDFLAEDRLLEAATATATKRVIAHQIARVHWLAFGGDRVEGKEGCLVLAIQALISPR